MQHNAFEMDSLCWVNSWFPFITGSNAIAWLNDAFLIHLSIHLWKDGHVAPGIRQLQRCGYMHLCTGLGVNINLHAQPNNQE